MRWGSFIRLRSKRQFFRNGNGRTCERPFGGVMGKETVKVRRSNDKCSHACRDMERMSMDVEMMGRIWGKGRMGIEGAGLMKAV